MECLKMLLCCVVGLAVITTRGLAAPQLDPFGFQYQRNPANSNTRFNNLASTFYDFGTPFNFGGGRTFRAVNQNVAGLSQLPPTASFAGFSGFPLDHFGTGFTQNQLAASGLPQNQPLVSAGFATHNLANFPAFTTDFGSIAGRQFSSPLAPNAVQKQNNVITTNGPLQVMVQAQQPTIVPLRSQQSGRQNSATSNSKAPVAAFKNDGINTTPSTPATEFAGFSGFSSANFGPGFPQNQQVIPGFVQNQPPQPSVAFTASDLANVQKQTYELTADGQLRLLPQPQQSSIVPPRAQSGRQNSVPSNLKAPTAALNNNGIKTNPSTPNAEFTGFSSFPSADFAAGFSQNQQDLSGFIQNQPPQSSEAFAVPDLANVQKQTYDLTADGQLRLLAQPQQPSSQPQRSQSGGQHSVTSNLKTPVVAYNNDGINTTPSTPTAEFAGFSGFPSADFGTGFSQNQQAVSGFVQNQPPQDYAAFTASDLTNVQKETYELTADGQLRLLAQPSIESPQTHPNRQNSAAPLTTYNNDGINTTPSPATPDLVLDLTPPRYSPPNPSPQAGSENPSPADVHDDRFGTTPKSAVPELPGRPFDYSAPPPFAPAPEKPARPINVVSPFVPGNSSPNGGNAQRGQSGSGFVYDRVPDHNAGNHDTSSGFYRGQPSVNPVQAPPAQVPVNKGVQFSSNNAAQYSSNNAAQYSSNNAAQYSSNNAAQYSNNNAAQYSSNNAAPFVVNGAIQYAGNNAASSASNDVTPSTGNNAAQVNNGQNPVVIAYNGADSNAHSANSYGDANAVRNNFDEIAGILSGIVKSVPGNFASDSNNSISLNKKRESPVTVGSDETPSRYSSDDGKY